jgi:hypothetical protein
MNSARPTEEYADTPGAPASYVWKIPGTAVNIQIRLDVVRGIRDYLIEAGPKSTEAGGLLIGNSHTGRTEITGFEPVFRASESGQYFVFSDPERSDLQRYIDEFNRGDRGKSVIGYFRSDLRNGICLYEEDKKLIKDCFPAQSNVFLVVRPRDAAPPAAGFFFWEDGSIFTAFSFMEFDFDETILGLRTYTADVEGSEPAHESRISEAAGALVPGTAGDKPAKHLSISRGSAIAALVGVALIIAVGAYLFERRLNIWNTVASAPDQVRARPVPAGKLGLSVASTGAEMNIAWDAESPLVRNARVGLLTIEDGDSRRDMPLTKVQLLSSRLVYTPRNDTVQVALEMFGEDGKVTREHVIAVSNTKSKAPGAQFETRVNTTIEKPSEEQESKRAAVRSFIAPAVRGRYLQPANTAPPAEPPAAVTGLVDLRQVAPPISQRPIAVVPAPAPAPTPSAPAAASSPPPMLVSRVPQQPPVPVRQIRPVLPDNVKAMLTSRSSVKVRIQVDMAGRVTAAEPISTGGSLDRFLGAAAASAARLWIFEPARDGQRKVAGEITASRAAVRRVLWCYAWD